MEPALDPDNRLIGYAGKDIMRNGFEAIPQDKQSLQDFVKMFRDVRSFHGDTIAPVLPLLKLGGISTNQICNEVKTALVDLMKRQIATLEQEALDAILDKCYSFLTVPELSPIGIAVLERLNYVGEDIWRQIVHNGLNDSPYTDLPLSIKKRIWVVETSAFDHEVALVLDRVVEVNTPTGLETFIMRPDRQNLRASNLLLKDLVRLATSVPDLAPRIVEELVRKAASAQTSPKRIALANLYHDFLTTVNTRTNPTLAQLKKMARYLDTTDLEANIDADMLEAIRKNICIEASCSTVGTLIASSYSRDFLAEQLVLKLLNRRGSLGDGKDQEILEKAAEHLREDPWIPNITFLTLCNMKAAPLIAEKKTPPESEADLPFQMFYPLLIHEMESDNKGFGDNYYTENAPLPDSKFLQIVQKGKLERRVVTSYCLQLFVHMNNVGLGRFRLVLDLALHQMDPTEEIREAAISYNLIMRIIEDMYPQG